MNDRQAIETALDHGQLWGKMLNNRYWRVRRNGATKLWKRSPERFQIPFKVGFKGYGRVTESSSVARITDHNWERAEFVASVMDPNYLRGRTHFENNMIIASQRD